MKKIILIFLFIFAFSAMLKAEPALLNKIEINPLNRVKFYFSADLVNFTAKISEDKTKISALIRNAKIGSQSSANGAGAISDVYARQNGADIEIGLNLKEKKGYTSLYLPYSKILQIETFDWGKISQEEDAYRSALLGLEDDLTESARPYLQQAADAKYPNALAILGILDVKAGKLTSGRANLLNAIKLKSDIADVYAGMYQIYKLKNDEKKAQGYLAAYKKLTGIEPSLFHIALIDSSQTFVNIINEDSLLAAIGALTDTSKIKTASDTTTKTIAVDSSKPAQNNNILSFIPQWVYYTVIGVIAFILFSLLVLYKSYLKWKEQVLAKRKANAEKKAANIKSPIKKIITPIPGANDSENDDFKPYTAKLFQKSAVKKEEPKKSETNDKSPNYTDKLSILLNDYAENVKREEPQERFDYEEPEQSPENTATDAKYEFAKRLQNQKSKSKLDKIGLMDDSDSDDDDIADRAKQMRVELGSIETKQSLNKFGADSDKLKELRKKMGGKE